jgi:hypothetical protein
VPERPIIVFDVNETLPDLDSIRPTFDRIFGEPLAASTAVWVKPDAFAAALRTVLSAS